MTILRQSTAVDILIGPFVDEDDGKTLEESLTISQADVMLSKNGQPLAQKNDNTACAFDDFGCYNCELDATDTNTVGELSVVVFEDGALPFRRDYQVIEEALYDAIYAASAAVIPANVTQWLGTAAATPTVAGVPEVDLTHVAGSTTSVSTMASTLATLLADIGGVATAAADGDPTSTDLLFAYIKQLINILIGSAGIVAWPASASPGNAVSLAEALRAIYDDTNALPDSGALTTVQSDLDNIQTRLPAALVSGRMDSDVAVIQANVITASAIATDAIGAAELADGAITAATFAAGAIDAAALAADASTEINAAVLAVLGALADAAADGAVTATDTVVAYVKQIINTLEGAPGIPTWPAAAAPGNAVSIAEALRYLYDQVGVAGAGLTAADDAVIAAIPSAATVADAVWDEDATAHQTGGTFGQAIGDPGANTETLFKAIVTDPAGTNIAADVIAMKADTAATLVDTNELQTDWTNGGRLDLLIDAIKAITDVLVSPATIATAVWASATRTLTAATNLSIPTAAQNATELLDQAAGVETGWTVRQAFRVFLAALSGLLSGAGSGTETITNPAGSKNRILATVDDDGNRTAIVNDVT